MNNFWIKYKELLDKKLCPIVELLKVKYCKECSYCNGNFWKEK